MIKYCTFNLPCLTVIIMYTPIIQLTVATSAITEKTDQPNNTRKNTFPVCLNFDTNTTTITIYNVLLIFVFMLFNI